MIRETTATRTYPTIFIVEVPIFLFGAGLCCAVGPEEEEDDDDELACTVSVEGAPERGDGGGESIGEGAMDVLNGFPSFLHIKTH